MILYLDCSSGIAGNMTVGALLDLGVPFPWLRTQLSHVLPHGYRLVCTPKKKGRVKGTYFNVRAEHGHHHGHDDHEHAHRPYREVRALIRSAPLPERIREKSLQVFRVLGEAEAKVHGTTLDKIHFHEVGAVDAVIDVVGAVLCLDRLKVKEIHASPLNVGFGRVKAAHGWMDVPPPATAEMLRKKKLPHYPGHHGLEMSTPTGVALVAALADAVGPLPRMEALKHGYGFGDYELPSGADALHAVLGKSLTSPTR